MLSSDRKCQIKLSLKEIGPSYDQNFGCLDNPGQNNWNKIEKSNKLDRTKKV